MADQSLDNTPILLAECLQSIDDLLETYSSREIVNTLTDVMHFVSTESNDNDSETIKSINVLYMLIVVFRNNQIIL